METALRDTALVTLWDIARGDAQVVRGFIDHYVTMATSAVAGVERALAAEDLAGGERAADEGGLLVVEVGHHHRREDQLERPGRALRRVAAGVPRGVLAALHPRRPEGERPRRADHGGALVGRDDARRRGRRREPPRERARSRADLEDSLGGGGQQGRHEALEHRAGRGLPRARLHAIDGALGLARGVEPRVIVDSRGLGHGRAWQGARWRR